MISSPVHVIPPHNLDAERAVLGALLLEGRETLPRMVEILRTTDFFTEAHRIIFMAMRELLTRGEPIDLITLSEELRRTGMLETAGGPGALALLVEHASIAAHLTRYADIVREKAIKRETIQGAMCLTQLASNGASLTEIESCADALVRDVKRGAGAAEGPAVVVRVADVEPEEVEWLWQGRLARGKLNLIVGNPGLGKSYITLDAAARISRGTSWPDGTPAPIGDVVLLSAEDGVADTIRPRLEVLAADLARVHVLTAVRERAVERGFSLGRDLETLQRTIIKTRAVLVVVDPISAYLGDRDSYKDAEVRSLLAPLAALAQHQRVAVVGVMHLTKDQQRQAIHRALGSVAFVASARVVLAVAPDREHEDRRVLVTVKNNLTTPAPAMAFKLLQAPGALAAVLAWEPQPLTGVSADMLLSPSETAHERDEHRYAVTFLRELLASGPVKASEGEEAAKAEGIASRTLDRARKSLPVYAYCDGFKPKMWWWSLSPKDTMKSATKNTTPSGVASFEERSPGKHATAESYSKNATVGDVASLDELDRGVSGPSAAEEQVAHVGRFLRRSHNLSQKDATPSTVASYEKRGADKEEVSQPSSKNATVRDMAPYESNGMASYESNSRACGLSGNDEALLAGVWTFAGWPPDMMDGASPEKETISP